MAGKWAPPSMLASWLTIKSKHNIYTLIHNINVVTILVYKNQLNNKDHTITHYLLAHKNLSLKIKIIFFNKIINVN